MKRKNLDSIIRECLFEVYRHTSPVLDLQEILDLPRDQQPEDWFEDYQIPEIVFESILGQFIDRYKLRGMDLRYFRVNMYLGPSPRFTPQNSSQDTSNP